jgi:hypothetical protein
LSLCLTWSVIQCLPEPARNEAREIVMPRKAKAAQGAASAGAQTTRARNAQATDGGETVSGYFRRVFKENPKLLKGRSNDELFRRWLADHPGETEVPRNVKVGLQNVKGLLRSKGRRKKRKKEQLSGQEGHGVVAHPTPKSAARKPNELEQLEERIDDVLRFARDLEREELENVVALLRRARNEVVWKLGQ